MGYKRIGDYGIVGDGLTLALIGIDGSVDWMCLPYMDSPSVFAANLDDEKGGRFRIRPAGAWDSVQSYFPHTNILKTLFRTQTGEAEVVDFMPAGPSAEGDPAGNSLLLRRITGVSGALSLEIQCKPRFRYGKKTPRWTQGEGNRWVARSGDAALTLFASEPMRWDAETGHIDFSKGDVLWLGLTWGDMADPPEAPVMARMLRETETYWKDWVRARETGKYPSHGFWQEILDRSALVMKLLQFRETGAIAAAGTCSFPAILYGQRNWDYRFSWIRDTSLTLTALFELGHTEEVSRYMTWIEEILRKTGPADLDILYQLRTPEPPTGERQLEHLSGYKGSRPVNIGQFNVGQHQHDIYGELLEMFFAMSRFAGKIDPDYWGWIRALVDHVVEIWREKDYGIWELRTGPHHVVHSKLMCWVALDRGIDIARHYGFPANLERWEAEREAVRTDLLENGYNEKRGAFTMHYDTDALDASVLRIPLVGFLPIDDPRVAGTIAAVEKELMRDGVLLRYAVDDGLPGQEHGFLICFFWYLCCLVRQGRLDETEGHLREVHRFANHLGLLGEQYDPRFREITGNIPQAFSHIGYAIAVLEYLNARKPRPTPEPVSLSTKARLLVTPRVLSPEESRKPEAPMEDPGKAVRRIMTVLRGQFYDGHAGRIDYPLIAGSDYYEDFLDAVAALRDFDPARLKTDPEKIAFWINVYNTLVIHGVIELGIADSVKEVPFFFERTTYIIGGREYALNDIEHGILRKNAVPPKRLRRRFRSGDPRQALAVETLDPRIHFSLVCASRTCPPVDAYDADRIDDQLETSATVFINGTTAVDKDRKTLSVSEIFKWYRADFPADRSELARYVAAYLYDAETGKWLSENADGVGLSYTPYDWRLNR